MCPAIQKHLNTLTEQGDALAVKGFIESLPSDKKGPVFERYLALLYVGNGWLVKVAGGSRDRGADILLYHPQTPSVVSMIVQAKNQSRPLSFDDTKIELIKFEQQAAPKHNCQQFNLVAVNGFVGAAEELNDFNMLLSNWDHVAGLLSSYKPGTTAQPEIELYAHNQNAYLKLKGLWAKSRCVAVVQATGTGKSNIIAKVLSDFMAVNKLVLAPSHYILDQVRSKAPWVNQSATFMTYARCANLTDEQIKVLAPGVIVLDEFHRCGAEYWGAGVQKILAAHPQTYVLGTSATPIRYLDNSRDMSDELFGGMVAVDMSLADAIVRRILPTPVYVAALYTLDEEIDELLLTIAESRKSDAAKKLIAADIQKVKLNWEKTSGIPQVLKKHLDPTINKIIVFCEDQQHLDEMEAEVPKWFQKAATHRWRKVFRVLTADLDSDKNLEEFKESRSPDTVHLLFSIMKLNEGVHIPEVGAVILLRRTASPTVFYQQIGRCIQTDMEYPPVIFDFVNNFQNICANDFLESLQEAQAREQARRKNFALGDYAPSLKVFDETKDILEVFEEISERLRPWEEMFEQLLAYKAAHGDCLVPDKWPENRQLGSWVHNQRSRRKNGTLSAERIRRLDEIGFSWDRFADFWREMFEQLMAYKTVHGDCDVPARWPENRQLATWVGTQRQARKIGTLPKEQISLLDKIGFSWDAHANLWEEMFEQLAAYKAAHGNCDIPAQWLKNRKLAAWVVTQRQGRKIGSLPNERISLLDEIGFSWDAHANLWEEMFRQLVAYKVAHGDCDVPDKWPENRQLATWVGRQRFRWKKGTLTEDQIQRLDAMGFRWDLRADSWEEMFRQLVAYKTAYGNCDVPQCCPENVKLATWVGTQRQRRKKGTLPEAQARRLGEIGFSWDPLAGVWEAMFQQLLAYKFAHGNCDVPARWSENRQLATWVRTQRVRKQKGTLPDEHARRLNEIGFSWNPYTDNWEEMFRQLTAYKKAHGDCDVPHIGSENKQLGFWVATQRRGKDKGKLSTEQIRRLDEIGFSWNAHANLWEEMLRQLAAYKVAHGNCDVPNGWPENRQLANWVGTQRNKKKKGTLSEERIRRLEAVGFRWSFRRGPRQRS